MSDDHVEDASTAVPATEAPSLGWSPVDSGAKSTLPDLSGAVPHDPGLYAARKLRPGRADLAPSFGPLTGKVGGLKPEIREIYFDHADHPPATPPSAELLTAWREFPDPPPVDPVDPTVTEDDI